jgi:cytochrome b subunit of formate dehydrogenase
MWAGVVAAVLFLVGHSVWVRARPAEAAQAPDASEMAGLPERIERHSLSARLFHWTMSAAMLALLVTAFVPVMGWQFAWVEIHWIAGVLLTLTVIYHVIHAVGWQDFWSMFRIDVGEGMALVRHLMSSKAPAPPRAGKYGFDHRMYHHGIVVVGMAAIVTGLLMMVRIDTPLWTRNPYLLSDSTWGVVYVVHGLAGVALIVMVAAHIYFAIRPEKRWMTWSMVRGWIDREHYLAHHDPAKWIVGGASPELRGGGGTDAPTPAAVDGD